MANSIRWAGAGLRPAVLLALWQSPPIEATLVAFDLLTNKVDVVNTLKESETGRHPVARHHHQHGRAAARRRRRLRGRTFRPTHRLLAGCGGADEPYRGWDCSDHQRTGCADRGLKLDRISATCLQQRLDAVTVITPASRTPALR